MIALNLLLFLFLCSAAAPGLFTEASSSFDDGYATDEYSVEAVPDWGMMESEGAGGLDRGEEDLNAARLIHLYESMQMHQKINTMDALLDKFRGRYEQMWDLLRGKYGNNAVDGVLRMDVSSLPMIDVGADVRDEGGMGVVPSHDGVAGLQNIWSTDKTELSMQLQEFFSIVDVRRLRDIPQLVRKYISKQKLLVRRLLKTYFPKSLFVWSQKSLGSEDLMGSRGHSEMLEDSLSEIMPSNLRLVQTYVERESLRDSLKEFYARVNSQKSSTAHIDFLLLRWKGNDDELVKRLASKYFPGSAGEWINQLRYDGFVLSSSISPLFIQDGEVLALDGGAEGPPHGGDEEQFFIDEPEGGDTYMEEEEW
eukprot:g2316.t1